MREEKSFLNFLIFVENKKLKEEVKQMNKELKSEKSKSDNNAKNQADSASLEKELCILLIMHSFFTFCSL